MNYTSSFSDLPLLEKAGWEKRRRLQDLVFDEEWGESTVLDFTEAAIGKGEMDDEG